MDELTLAEFITELKKPGVRCALQVRHAERPRIDPNDPSFGDHLALTDEGSRTSRKLGELLADFKDDVTFVSSPLRRTVMTAELIAEGMGVEAPSIPTFGCLGNETFYFANAAEVLVVFQPGNFFDSCFKYYEEGEMKGFHNLFEASDKLEAWLLGHLEKKLLIATTHDCYIAAYLAAKTRYRFSRETWTRFLDGGALLLYPDGTKRYALVRAGLSTGICGVGGKVM